MIRFRKFLIFLLFISWAIGMRASMSVGNFTYIGYDTTPWGTQLAEVSAANKYISGYIEIPGAISANGVQYSIAKVAEEGFQMCTSITSLSLPPTLIEVKRRAFFGCRSMTSVQFRDVYDPLTIGDEAFSNCSKLSEVEFPERVSSIGGSVFNQCTSLVSVSFPSTLRKVGKSTFSMCTKLSSVKAASLESWCKIEFEDFQANPFSAGIYSIAPVTLEISGETLRNLTIPTSVTSVSKYAFANYQLLDEVTFPAHVKSIGEGCFLNAKISKITSLNPEPPVLGQYCFDGVSKSTPVYVLDTALAAYTSAPGWSEFKNYITISTETADRFLYDGMMYSALTDSTCSLIDGKDGVETIPETVYFQGHPYTVTEIGEKAFRFSKISNLTIPDCVETIGTQGIASSSLTNVLIGKGIRKIGAGTFEVKTLEQMTILADNLPEFSFTVSEATNDGITRKNLLFNSKKVLDEWKAFCGTSALTKWSNANYRHLTIDGEIDKSVNLVAGGIAYPFKVQIYESNILQPFAYTYKSGNEHVAKVVETLNGATGPFIVPVGAGSTDITVSSNTGLSTVIKVKVTPSLERIWFDETSQTVNVGGKLSLIPHVYPEGAEVNYKWSSSNADVAFVDNTSSENIGVVTARKAGKTTIKVSTHVGLSAECEVIVTQPVTGVTLNLSEATIEVGESIALEATVSPENATDKTLTWRSSDETVATVNESGVVKAKAPGNTTITVTTSNGISASCVITVTQPVIGVTLNLSEATIEVGESIALEATVSPENATDKTLTWRSSDETVATVNDLGVVKAQSAGKTTITVTTSNGISASCVITVTQPVTGVSLNLSEATIEVGESIALEATVSPETATDKTLTWRSSDETVATVNESGVVKAQSAGKTTITVTTSNGISASCVITVTQPVTGVTLNLSEATIEVGESIALEATVSPDNATDKTLTWRSSDETVATVNESGVVKAQSAGNTTITVTTSNGISVACVITVTQPVTGVTLNLAEATIEVGESIALEATVSPDNATDKTLTWRSSDEAVATVNDLGVVKAQSAGNTTITVTTSNGISASCVITVVRLVESLAIIPDYVTLKIGESMKLVAEIFPSDADNPTLIWSSSDESIAIVSTSGLVASIGEGECEIYAETTDGSGLKATCHLSSTSGVDSIFNDSDSTHDIYNLNGVLLKRDATAKDFELLPPGLYIIDRIKVHKTH
jgi:uncharacterized protein YjdB